MHKLRPPPPDRPSRSCPPFALSSTLTHYIGKVLPPYRLRHQLGPVPFRLRLPLQIPFPFPVGLLASSLPPIKYFPLPDLPLSPWTPSNSVRSSELQASYPKRSYGPDLWTMYSVRATGKNFQFLKYNR